MYFIDLEKLKLIRTYNFNNSEIISNIDINSSIKELKEHFAEATTHFNFSKMETCYTYEIVSEDNSPTTKEEAESFLTVVNIILICFFNHITQEKGRKREHRLDVPEKLRKVHISMSLLKKAINQQTITDKFNLIVKYKDLQFILVDEQDIEQRDFIHSTEELEVSYE